MHTCTVRHAIGGACGKPAVYSWTSRDGEVFAECAEHYIAVNAAKYLPSVGDDVPVHRHGKTYTGTVVKVGARGAVYAKVTYDNGVTRTVRP